MNYVKKGKNIVLSKTSAIKKMSSKTIIQKLIDKYIYNDLEEYEEKVLRKELSSRNELGNYYYELFEQLGFDYGEEEINKPKVFNQQLVNVAVNEVSKTSDSDKLLKFEDKIQTIKGDNKLNYSINYFKMIERFEALSDSVLNRSAKEIRLFVNKYETLILDAINFENTNKNAEMVKRLENYQIDYKKFSEAIAKTGDLFENEIWCESYSENLANLQVLINSGEIRYLELAAKIISDSENNSKEMKKNFKAIESKIIDSKQTEYLTQINGLKYSNNKALNKAIKEIEYKTEI